MLRKLLTASSLLATIAGPVQAEDFVIGAVSAKTGFMAAYDAPFMQGVSMYVEQANANGGLNGQYPIKLIDRDDKSDPQQGAIVIAELLNC